MKSNRKKIAMLIMTVMLIISAFGGCASDETELTQDSIENTETATEREENADNSGVKAQQSMNGQQPSLDEKGNEIGQTEDVYTFDNAPVEIVRENTYFFELPTGETHWYEVVYLPEGGVNWIQAKNLAEQAGGYLVSFHSAEENEFVFNLISDEKYWYVWEENNVCNGPFIGAFQPEGSEEPDGGWKWISGEEWTYTNWAVDNMEGDEDPRPNDQPNDATGNQCVGAFGEITIPVATWGDFPRKVSSYNDSNDAKVYGFIIEYDQEPAE